LDPECRITVADFEGPLDLLLYLINKNKLEITDIPIALVTRQYLEYLEIIRALNVAVAGEYLVMAATLIHIKSRMLLPVTESSENPLIEITGPLKELAEARRLAGKIEHTLPMLGRDIFYCGVATLTHSVPKESQTHIQTPYIEAKVADLIEAMERVMERASQNSSMNINSKRISITEQIKYVLKRLEQYNGKLSFFDIFMFQGRNFIIATFLALLELAKQARIRLVQEKTDGDIIIIST
jgi:segregation and condensation protein A